MVRARALMLACALAAVGMVPANATHGSGGCGSPAEKGIPKWQSSTYQWCTFDIRGFPVTVAGEARDPTSSNREVTIRVWVTIAEEHSVAAVTGHQPASVVLACEATGRGYASCEDDLSIDQVVDVQRGFIGRWRCNASATPSGSWQPQLRYYCSVGTGIG